MQAADENTQEWQKAIKKGDCFWQDTEYGFQIYGEVLKNAPRANTYTITVSANATLKLAEGEIGDVHLSVISGLLTREEFEEKIQAL